MTMDENMLKFDEKLKELLASAKKKKNTLDYQEIIDTFADIDLDPDKMDKIFDYLEASNIDIIRTTDDDEEPLLLDDDDDIDIEINPADLRIDVYRASGAGGQHVNKTESAVRITHMPSGIVVQCQNDRSQHKNKDQAMKQLKAKLYELELQKKNANKQAMEDNKSDIGWGSQIRSYVLDDARIKDLRTGVENRNTQAVLDGDLDRFIEASLKAGL